MRTKIIAGNWKMNKTLSESITLASGIVNGLNNINTKAEVIICPPFTSLETVNSLIKNSKVKLGAQNMHFEDHGAFTGEISAAMLKSVGCEFVILGHSERRHIFMEPDEMINKKIKKALGSNLKPVFCIGETLEERESNSTFKVLETQVRNGLANVTGSELLNIIIAYEPVWAIGTGKTATPEQAQEVHQFLRNLISQMFSEESSKIVRILYGGSVKPSNAESLLSKEDIDGALVGGACLQAESFLQIISVVN